MTKDEIIKIIGILSLNYEKFSIKIEDKNNLNTISSIWFDALKDTDYNISLKAVKKIILNSKEMPTIYEIKKTIQEMKRKETEDEAWNRAYKVINRGIYMSEEEFEKLDSDLKSFFIDIENLKKIAKTKISIVNTEIKKKFLKYYNG